MKTILTPTLSIGDDGDCHVPDANEAVVHAAKHSCYLRAVGGTVPAKDHPQYLGVEAGAELWLNLIDPPKPLFQRRSFEWFLSFARRWHGSGRRLFIHCNRGESRAPSLALLFMAKVTGELPDTSYDDAYDAFEGMCPGYKPGAGIETFMRENWHDIGEKPKAAPSQLGPVKAEVPDDPEKIIALLRDSALTHFGLMARITDKDGKLLTPVPTEFQLRVFAAYQWCLDNGVPIRIVQLKPRQSGGSTVSAYLCYRHSRRYHLGGLMMADEGSRTDQIWRMFNQYGDNDRFSPHWDSMHSWNTEKAKFTFQEEGVERAVEWLRETANDSKAGAAGTRHILWFSESARYNKSGDALDTLVIGNCFNSLPSGNSESNKLTMAILESTAEGSSGYHFETYGGAVTLEERIAGKIGNGWIKIFSPWHECNDYQLPRTTETDSWFNDEDQRFERFKAREDRGRRLYAWNDAQVAWRRWKIISDLKNDERLFDRDYPDCEEVAWQASGNPRFDITGVTRLQEMARLNHGNAQRGTLDTVGENLAWTPSKGEGWVWCKEEPLYGCAYIAALDPMTGEQSAGSRERDAHAFGVIRKGFMDKNGVTHDSELVATIDVPDGCAWDMDLLVDRIAQVLRWYGNPFIVVESNNAGVEAIRLLRQHGCRVVKRQKFDALNPTKTLEVYGFQTTNQSKALWVGALASAIREQNYTCCYLPAANECATFVTNASGTGEGMPGTHDDWITMQGLGLLHIDVAVVLRPPEPIQPCGELKPAWNGRGIAPSALT